LISYEIFFRDETSASFKAPEIEACRDLAFAVCQDALRTGKLCQENGIDPGRVVQIPVAGRGFRAPIPKPRVLHDRFKLPPDTKVALYVGSFEQWTHAPFLLESTHHWPEDWVLVIHERYGTTPDAELHYRTLGNESRLRISRAAFPSTAHMAEFIQSADLGVALYHPTYTSEYTGGNIAYIGLASGKISTYLQHGVPVATHPVGEFSDLILAYGAGEIFSLDRPFVPTAPGPEMIDACRVLFETRLDLANFRKDFLHAVDTSHGS